MSATRGLGASVFSSSVTNAIKIISHVWTQVGALEELVDAGLPSLLKAKTKLIASNVGCATATDSTRDVSIAYVWRYELKDGSDESKKGKKKRVGYLHFQVALTADVSDSAEELTDAFVPSIGIYVGGNEYGNDDLGVYSDYGTDESEGVRVEDDAFVVATLGAYRLDSDNEPTELWAYIPLESVNSDNVKPHLLGLAVRLIEHWLSVERERKPGR